MSNTVWTFGPSGLYTATWDGVATVTVTQTSGGAFVESFAAESLSQALGSPEYAQLLEVGSPVVNPLALVATTETNYPTGFALQNGTPTILSWTAPNDGQLHRFQIIPSADVTSTMTGGQVNATWTYPDGNGDGGGLVSGGQVAGNNGANFISRIIAAGSTVTIKQTSALTGGAAKMWAEIWAS